MKKTIIASSLAVGLGLVAGNVSHADASENQINKEKLAQLAESNDQSLNQYPIQEGAYNYQFNLNGKTYHFWSDGTYFKWEYYPSNGSTVNSANQNVASTQSAQNVSFQNNNYNHINQSASTSNVSQHYANEAQTQQAPKTAQTKQATQTQQAPASATTNQPKQSTSGSSVNVNSHLQQIAQRESGGDIHAINPSSGAAGKYQFLQSTWDSVAPAQYKGVSPAQAPESVQDAAAVKLYNTAGPSQWVTA
ncbi:transglycosylase family protein [Staphylococcus hominis]|uniref:transglycosylase family protein n=1 Tax=Staphylococcus hominis TaxID=1290 RepID=UPI00091E2537|nr:transglycosylase family protein [Staphylococcus hominis]MDU7695035.1 transglycosylase family protein [Staphylococcus sp.]MBF2307686.1 transglycosylase family protein [Staphylococcus hominis]MBF2316698.1 transglycosylase family protein [Staphylococcus hominis]MBF2321008.1 transglycosylase family protein [Staphylococcus hominis]MCD8791514.1 transglycosylase family protein [Staphylococcus hominis]